MPEVCLSSRNRRLHPVISLFIGILFGFLIAIMLRSFIPHHLMSGCIHHRIRSVNRIIQENVYHENIENISKQDKTLLFIGVMTAQKFLESRALAIHSTWGQNVPGKLLFFSSSVSKTLLKIPLVPLMGVDDSYPPQKKSFLMLKYMHDHYIDKFEWFMRADDDVYIRMDKLEKFLRSINSSKPQFIGQAGVGKEEEFGQLNLEPDDNFCMGGPGIIMSRMTLKLLVPHIRYCLKHLYSTHEDVEIGRCVKKFVGIPCTWSYEMQSIFYHSFSGEGVFTRRLKVKDIHRAITLHPIKQPLYLYRLHSYFLGLQSQELRYKILRLNRELQDMIKYINEETSTIKNAISDDISVLGSRPILNKFYPNNSDEVLIWDYLSKNIYSAYNLNPKRRMEVHLQTAINDTIMEVMEMINKFSKQRGRIIDFKDLLYGYIRVNPLYGVDYILDMLLTYKKYRGKKMTVPVRRHAYLYQAFSEPEIREIKEEEFETSIQYRGSNIDSNSLGTVIHFILPLSGRVNVFKRFLKNFEEVCLKMEENVELAVVLFSDGSLEDAIETKTVFEDLRNRYPNYLLRLVEASGMFSRALALEIGAKLYSSSALLFFVDVDIILDNSVLRRIRMNTIKGKQAYFPIVFSEYNPKYIQNVSFYETTHIDENRGYWRQFGFGIVSLYHGDLQEVGGLDTGIQGWGKEDVDLYNKIVHSNISVFRAVDPGLIHLFHPIECSQQLDKAQYDMCLGSKYSSLASAKRLTNIIMDDLHFYMKMES